MKESLRRVVLIGSYIYLTILWLDYRFKLKSQHNSENGGLQIGDTFYSDPLTLIIRGYWQGFVALIVLIVCFLVAHKAINWIFQKGE